MNTYEVMYRAIARSWHESHFWKRKCKASRLVEEGLYINQVKFFMPYRSRNERTMCIAGRDPRILVFLSRTGLARTCIPATHILLQRAKNRLCEVHGQGQFLLDLLFSFLCGLRPPLTSYQWPTTTFPHSSASSLLSFKQFALQ